MTKLRKAFLKRWDSNLKLFLKISIILSIIIFLVGGGYFLVTNIKPYRIIDSLSKDHPIRKDFERFGRLYPNENTIYLLVKDDVGVADPNFIKKIRELVKELQQVRFLKAIDSFTTAKYPVKENKSFKLLSLAEGNVLTPTDKKVFSLPPYSDLFFTQNKKGAILYLTVMDEVPLKKRSKIVSSIEQVIQNHNLAGKAFLMGDLVVQKEIQKEVRFSNLILLPFFTLGLLLLFYFFFRSMKISLLSLFTLGLSYLATLFFIAFWERSLGPIGSISLFFVFAIATSDLVHFFSAYDNTLKRAPRVILPCLLTSATTLIGFLSLTLSPLVKVSNLGLYCSFGIIVAYFATFFLMPFIIRLFEIELVSLTTNQLRANVDKYSLFLINKKNWIVTLFFIPLLFTPFVIKPLHFDDRFLDIFVEDHTLSVSANEFVKEAGFVGAIELIIKEDRNLWFTKMGLNTSDELEKDILGFENVKNVLSYKQIPLFMHEMGLDIDESLRISKLLDQFGGFKAFLPNLEGEMRVQIFLKSLNTADIQGLKKKIIDLLRSKYKITENRFHFTGYSIVREEVSTLLYESFLISLGFTFVGVFLFVLVYFRSFKISLLGMIPNILPIFTLYVISILFNVNMDYNLIIMNALIIGIGIDDTIHFLHFFSKSKKTSIPEKIKDTLENTLYPLTKTTVALIFCFPLLFLTPFKLYHNLALFLVLGFSIALICDLVLLPSLLLILNGCKKQNLSGISE